MKTEDYNLIHAHLDDELSDAQQAEFDARLAHDPAFAELLERYRVQRDQLRTTLELDGAVDRVMGGLSERLSSEDAANTVIPIRGARSLGHARFMRGVYAAAAILVPFVLWWQLSGPPRVTPEALYREWTTSGFVVDHVCTADEFGLYMRQYFQTDLRLAQVPGNVEFLGWKGISKQRPYDAEPDRLLMSNESRALLVRVGDRPVVVFVDRAASDRALREPGAGLTMHRRVVGDAVFYEVSPETDVAVLPLIKMPPRPAAQDPRG